MKLTARERFDAKVNLNGPLPEFFPELGPCHVWTASEAGGGYGQFHITGQKTMKPSHVWAWEQENGPVPEGYRVDHLCSRRRCVRLTHLRLVTDGENAQHLTGARKHNTNGIRGVHKIGNRYYARAVKDGVEYRVKGGFATPEEAGEAARLLRLQLHTHNDLDRRE